MWVVEVDMVRFDGVVDLRWVYSGGVWDICLYGFGSWGFIGV